MTTYQDISPEEFIKASRSVWKEEQERVHRLEIDRGVRIMNHRHEEVPNGKYMACKLKASLHNSARYHGRAIRTAHDGADLVVFRIR